jgi:hypothetical protein
MITHVPRPEGGFYTVQALRQIGFTRIVPEGVSSTTGGRLSYTGILHHPAGCQGQETTPTRHGWRPEEASDEVLATYGKNLCDHCLDRVPSARVGRSGRRAGVVREPDAHLEEQLRSSARTIDDLEHQLASARLGRVEIAWSLFRRGYTQRDITEIYNAEAQVPLTMDAFQKAFARITRESTTVPARAAATAAPLTP